MPKDPPPIGEYKVKIDVRVLLSDAVSSKAFRTYALIKTFHHQKDGRRVGRLSDRTLSEILGYEATDCLNELRDIGIFDSRFAEDWRSIPMPQLGGHTIAERLGVKRKASHWDKRIDVRPFFCQQVSDDGTRVWAAILAEELKALECLIGFWKPVMKEHFLELAELGFISYDPSRKGGEVRKKNLKASELKFAEFTFDELGKRVPGIVSDSEKSAKTSKNSNAQRERRQLSREMA